MSGVDVVVGVRVVVVVVVVVVGVVVVVVVVDAVVEAVVVVAVDVVVVAVGSVIVVVVVTVVAVVVVVVVVVVIVIVVVEVMRVDSVGAGVVAGSVWRYVGEKCLWISDGGGKGALVFFGKEKGAACGLCCALYLNSMVWKLGMGVGGLLGCN